MFDKYYQESTTERKIEMLAWELEALAYKIGDSEIGSLATQMKIKFWERQFGTTLEEFIKKQNEEKGDK